MSNHPLAKIGTETGAVRTPRRSYTGTGYTGTGYTGTGYTGTGYTGTGYTGT